MCAIFRCGNFTPECDGSRVGCDEVQSFNPPGDKVRGPVFTSCGFEKKPCALALPHLDQLQQRGRGVESFLEKPGTKEDRPQCHLRLVVPPFDLLSFDRVDVEGWFDSQLDQNRCQCLPKLQ